MVIEINRVDHFVLTVTSVDKSCDFYSRVLGMEVITFGAERKALRFGEQKINLHQAGRELSPHAAAPTPGSGDFCLVTATPLAQVVAHLREHDVVLELGPVARTGAIGSITSVYFRDPDNNLIEVACYDGSTSASA